MIHTRFPCKALSCLPMGSRNRTLCKVLIATSLSFGLTDVLDHFHHVELVQPSSLPTLPYCLFSKRRIKLMLMYYFTVFHLSHSFFHLATSLSFVKSAGSVSWIGSHLFCFRDFVNIAAILSDSLVFSAVESYISTTSRACFRTVPKAL